MTSIVTLFCLIAPWSWNQGTRGSHIPVILQLRVRAEALWSSPTLLVQASRSENLREYLLCGAWIFPGGLLHTWSIKGFLLGVLRRKDYAQHNSVGPPQQPLGHKTGQGFTILRARQGSQANLGFPTRSAHKQSGLP